MLEGGGLRVNDNAVAVEYNGASPIATFREHLRTGRIVGSTDAAHGLGYAEASAVAVVPPVFGSVDPTTVLIRLMLYGDADWNGAVNLEDFNRLAANFGQSNKVWTDGDFTTTASSTSRTSTGWPPTSARARRRHGDAARLVEPGHVDPRTRRRIGHECCDARSAAPASSPPH